MQNKIAAVHAEQVTHHVAQMVQVQVEQILHFR